MTLESYFRIVECLKDWPGFAQFWFFMVCFFCFCFHFFVRKTSSLARDRAWGGSNWTREGYNEIGIVYSFITTYFLITKCLIYPWSSVGRKPLKIDMKWFWQSSCIRHERSVFQIQSSAFYFFWKDKNKWKRGRAWPFLQSEQLRIVLWW